MKWYIVRHADKAKGDFYNPLLRHQDEPISTQGIIDAQKLCPYFAEKHISHIFISQYIRTRQTIEFVAQDKKIIPKVDGRLNEIENGNLERMTDQEVQQMYPDIWNAYLARDRDFQFPGGESGQDALRRIEAFIDEKKEDQQDMIIVSHDGWIRLFMCHILGLPVYRRWDFQVDTCAIMEIEYQFEFERWKVVRFNHVCKMD